MLVCQGWGRRVANKALQQSSFQGGVKKCRLIFSLCLLQPNSFKHRAHKYEAQSYPTPHHH